jgi:hypothetical protein
MCLDKGYDYDEVRDILHDFGFTAHIRPRGEEAKAIKREAGFKARRWVVERAHSWMNRFRRLLIRWDKKPANYLALLHFACGLIAFRAAGLFGQALRVYPLEGRSTCVVLHIQATHFTERGLGTGNVSLYLCAKGCAKLSLAVLLEFWYYTLVKMVNRARIS